MTNAGKIPVIITLLFIQTVAYGGWTNPKARPPQASPQRRSAGESVPPLPLPATPLRRSERKRTPSPPALVGMMNFSTGFVLDSGRRKEAENFPTTVIDIERLMNAANSRLAVKYRYVSIALDKFNWDVTNLPLLYVTGWTPMPEFPEHLLAKMRRYLYDGGTIVFHAQCGREEFQQSAVRQIHRIFPDRRLSAIDTDSPFYSAVYPISEMRFRKDDQPFKAIPPYLEAVYLGCRPAIIYSPIDLNCGWDVVNNPIQGGVLYHQQDATALGINIIAVVLSNMQYARSWGTRKIFYESDQPSRGRLVIGQIVHQGQWDPSPQGLANLMKYIAANTTLKVQFRRELVNIEDEKIFDYPVLYITGLQDFKFSDRQAGLLREYLNRGGIIFGDCAAGRKAFDAAFRRELRRVVPDKELEIIEPQDQIFKVPFEIKNVQYAPMVKAVLGDLNQPYLEGIAIGGQLAVIYSRFSLTNGWEQLGFAYNRGYGNSDALRLGVNILAYSLMH